MDMQAIIDDWRANAERNDDRNFRFLRSLKMQSDNVVDRVAHQLHEEAFSIVDCTKCANCCKTTPTGFRSSDIRRIAKHLGVEPEEFAAKHLEKTNSASCSSRQCRVRFWAATIAARSTKSARMTVATFRTRTRKTSPAARTAFPPTPRLAPPCSTSSNG